MGIKKREHRPVTMGVIVGNRGFFPGHLCEEGRKEILQVLDKAGIRPVLLSPEDTKYGAVSTLDNAKKCAKLFQAYRDEIDGVLITLPNFGDEKAIANTLRLAGLDVPVLVHAFADDPSKMSAQHRRDSFCGKMSVCNNLTQYRIPYSITQLHTVDPKSESFRNDLLNFASVCRVVKSLRSARIGAIGARPADFNTVRYSEKLLEANGITVETIDLSEVFGKANRLKDEDPVVKEKLESIRSYVETKGIPEDRLVRMSKFGVIVDRWMEESDLSATAVQCWTSMEEFFGVVPCTIMSMMSNSLLPSACEVDIPGLVGMYALQEASDRPSAIVDWNNNYGEDPDKAVIFHCSNLPKDVFSETTMDYQRIISNAVGKENTFGTIAGRVKPGAFTYARVSTDDLNGSMSAYVGEGELTNDPLMTFGGYGVVKIPNLQGLLHTICEKGFEHHVAVNLSQKADALNEAMGKYLNWNVYHHQG
ncbi:L-fucose/L-arabinose isomerase family protein [Paludifilum halophilum]|uniref:Fucose isomerase n=1 Tax=Paludifilum halophilum TaxID=1642702 RepID=A0A235B4E2_9BACL|nr:L-fucose/L-arabinose isomerase family protein [Paludifilum halophilum]OYD07170.1 fucose isomerase [Paludifilum halophilum]